MTGVDGVLEIRDGPGNGGEEDPDQIQLQSPFGDASAGGPGELEAAYSPANSGRQPQHGLASGALDRAPGKPCTRCVAKISSGGR
jgi:hypothetical protein